MPITKAKRAAQAGVVVRQIRAATTLPHVASTIEVGCLDMSDPECTSATLLVSHIYQKVGPSLCSRRQLLWCAEGRPAKLSQTGSTSALALMFLVLTATRV